MMNKTITLLLLSLGSLHLEAQHMMNTDRMDKRLKAGMDSTASLEIDNETFLHHPEIIQQERAAFTRNNPAPRPENIQVSDVFVNSSRDNYKIRLHVYQAKNFDADHVIVYFHGGGYVFGMPEQVDEQMFKIAADLKATIISVDYRLSPQYKFPIPVLDGYDALQWTVSNGKTALNINPDNIVVFGASAGGHLAAAVAQMAADHQVKNIRHQFLLYPVIHNQLNTPSMNEFVDAPLWSKTAASAAWLHFLGKEKMGQSIRFADLTNFDKFRQLPPATIVACELDPLRDEDIAYAQQLYKAGVKTELWVIPGAVHIFDLFSSPLREEFYRFMIDKMEKVWWNSSINIL
ncbi:acetyl esterase [Chitinophaga eiseniae]|uniref:Acetyl esterase n=1 Tax=Chitinophaga eiseniae TaxID=634771 RepID=A0A1T4LAI5_9BACT|nr:alpha/beta hydrolase [Chitinophaga eiseniae]SJZ51517.1 acetyl esterase [Chitinophaga eiseniae]